MMGFPESFVLSRDGAHRMLGNAVCPPGRGRRGRTLLVEAPPNDSRREELVEKLRTVSIRS